MVPTVPLLIMPMVFAFCGLAWYAMRSKVRLKVSASLLKLASFSIEVESQDGRQGGKLPPEGNGQGLRLGRVIPLKRPAE